LVLANTQLLWPHYKVRDNNHKIDIIRQHLVRVWAVKLVMKVRNKIQKFQFIMLDLFVVIVAFEIGKQ